MLSSPRHRCSASPNTSAWRWRKASGHPWARRRPRASRSCSNGFKNRRSAAPGSPAPTFRWPTLRQPPTMVRLEMLKLSRMWDPQARRRPVVGAGQGATVLRDRDHEVAAARGHRALREDRRPLGQREREPRGGGPKTSMTLVRSGRLLWINIPLRGGHLGFGLTIMPDSPFTTVVV